jgi:hypothetical protein
MTGMALNSRPEELYRLPEPSAAASGILVQSLRAATGCEFDLVRKRPDHGNGLRPWMPKQPLEFYSCATEPPPLTRISPCEPVTRRVWAPIGKRPIAHGHHRFDWLYVTAFASPATGETFWYLSNGVSKEFFEALLETFAREAEAGLARIIVLVLDNAGWHGAANLKIPDGIRLISLTPPTRMRFLAHTGLGRRLRRSAAIFGPKWFTQRERSRRRP